MASRVVITERRARDLRPDPKRDTFLRDAEVIGFGVRCKPSGAKSWFVEYRNASGRNRRMFLGAVGTLRLSDATSREGERVPGARSLARDVLAMAAAGRDPLAERSARRKAVSVREMMAAYVAHLETRTPEPARPSTLAELRRLIEKEIKPRLGSRKAEDVAAAEVAAVHREIGERAPVLANRVLFYLAAAYNHHGTYNPCKAVKPHRERQRERVLSAEELARLGAVLAAAEDAPPREVTRDEAGRFAEGEGEGGSESPAAVLALRLLLLSGMRRGEVLSLTWDQVDFERYLVHIPDRKSKSGHDVVLPMTAPVRELLAKAPRYAGNPYVCPGTRPGAPLGGLPRVWRRIRKRARLPGLRIHDLRHGFGSALAGNRESLLVIGKLLGHREARTTERYANLPADPVRAAAERAAKGIEAALEGEAGELVPIEEARRG